MKEETTYGHQELINQAIDYIHTHLHQTLSSEMLAMEMNMSVYHFHRLFKSYLQETISAYITRQRMERAVMYLQTRDLSLQELSEKVGYDTPQSFSKAFKRYFGFSPIAFRNTLLLVTTETTMAEDISSIGLQEPEVLLHPYHACGIHPYYRSVWREGKLRTRLGKSLRFPERMYITIVRYPLVRHQFRRSHGYAKEAMPFLCLRFRTTKDKTIGSHR